MIILASQSPRRRDLLNQIGVSFTVDVAAIDEPAVLDALLPLPDSLKSQWPEIAVKALAEEKAAAVLARHPEDWVLGADTVVALDGEIIGKPHSPEEAEEMLLKLAGREHTVYTGVCLTSAQGRKTFVDSAQVTFYPADHFYKDFITEYIASGSPLDKAGAYGIQDGGVTLIRQITGDYTTVMGLPAPRVRRLLAAFNIPIH